jgi:hypothetical protein
MVMRRTEVTTFRGKFANRYKVFWLESSDEGCAGYELCFDEDGVEICVCRVVFWDAVGQYFLELPNGEMRMSYVLQLLKETIERVNVPMGDFELFVSAQN